MKHATLVAFAAALTCTAALHAATTEPWDAAYTGDDAAGSGVLGLWSFDADSPAAKLSGAVINPAGKFGPCLETFNDPTMRTRHAAVIAGSPALSPRGAFSLEMWLAIKADMPANSQAYLIDKKYASEDDYQVLLGPADKAGLRSIRAVLGFGSATETVYGESQKFAAGAWHHLALTYDGLGHAAIYFDGSKVGEGHFDGRKGISAGTRTLSIGDRAGSNYAGFSGYIDQVRLTAGVREFRRAMVTTPLHRAAYVRMEQAPPIRVVVHNLQRVPIENVGVTMSMDGYAERKFTIDRVAPGSDHALELPIDTTLRPGKYQLRTRIEVPGVTPSEETFPITIVSRPLPQRMPVLMWGQGSLKEMGRLKDLGYTHCLGLRVDYGKVWEAGGPVQAVDDEMMAAQGQLLDEALINDLSFMMNLSPGRHMEKRAEFGRVSRKGQPYGKPDADGLYPKLQEFCFNVGASAAKTYGPYPAFKGALVHSEVRGASQVSFNPIDVEAYRTFSGGDIPVEISEKSGIDYHKLKDFPADRVVADDDALLKYFRWFWDKGDGWNVLHSRVADGIRSAGRSDLWTFHDPAVRVPSLWGNGGDVDVLSQWTYSYPDPVRIGMPTDELFAMAAGHTPAQRVMKMTQIIWYRSQTAPLKKQGAYETKSVWEDTDPDAAFITISPAHLREAFWSEMSRPVQGIMNHGWGSLVEQDKPGSYRCTNLQTQNEVRRLVKTVVEPLGPALMQAPDVKSDVAFLESFTSQMLTRRGAYGWAKGWSADVYQALQYAQLQPEVVYEQTVERDGLGGRKVLVMVDCDVLTKSMVERVKAFQEAGGVVIGDENLCPAIEPGVRLTVAKRSGKADADQQALVKMAAELRSKLDQKYTRRLESDNPLVLTRLRRYGTSDYVFYVNDRREFGDYVGRSGLVMENGLPSEATIRLGRNGGAAYDLVEGRAVEMKRTAEGRSMRVAVGPGGGGVILVTESPIARVVIEAAESIKRGGTIEGTVSVMGETGKPVNAVVPVKIEVLDPDGRVGEFSGYYGAAGGVVKLKLDIAANDASGLWQVRVTELAGRHESVRYFRVVP